MAVMQGGGSVMAVMAFYHGFRFYSVAEEACQGGIRLASLLARPS